MFVFYFKWPLLYNVSQQNIAQFMIHSCYRIMQIYFTIFQLYSFSPLCWFIMFSVWYKRGLSSIQVILMPVLTPLLHSTHKHLRRELTYLYYRIDEEIILPFQCGNISHSPLWLTTISCFKTSLKDTSSMKLFPTFSVALFWVLP